MNANLQEIVISHNESMQGSSGQSRQMWINNMMTETSEEINASNRLTRPLPKVPSTFRQIKQNETCYDPSIVSIGPYHHGKPKLMAMEKLKITLARQFVKDSGTNQQENMYNRVSQVAREVRQCYVEDTEMKQFNDEEFAKMMFLDGCFILQFLFCLLEKPENLKMSGHDVALVARDLFLLENQIPFKVLDELMELRFHIREGGEREELFERFFNRIRSMPPQRKSCREKMSKFLLIISNSFRSLLTQFSSTVPKSQEDKTTATPKPAHLLEHFHHKFVARRNDAPAVIGYKDDSPKTWSSRYYPAEELRNVGIHFKPSTHFFTDVRFTPTFLAGRLYIPPLRIDDSTKPFLLNLVAYEACLGTSNDWITSYVCFMDSLIDHHKDVKELRSKGILLSTLGSDKQVAELFNEISDYLVPNPYAYKEVKRAIEDHYRNGIKRWVLHYKGPIYTFIFKYSFIYGLIVTAIKGYVSLVPKNPVFGICKMAATNVTHCP